MYRSCSAIDSMLNIKVIWFSQVFSSLNITGSVNESGT